MTQLAPIQRYCRSTVLLALILGGAIGFLAAYLRWPQTGMEVTFHNVGNSEIQTLQLDFGNADGQSQLRAFRIAVGEQRTLLINQPPGHGFNVKATFKGGGVQQFCALKGDTRRRVTVPLALPQFATP